MKRRFTILRKFEENLIRIISSGEDKHFQM